MRTRSLAAVRPAGSPFGRRAVTLAALFAAVTAAPPWLAAQASLTGSVGAAPYDLSGTGTSGIAAVRFDLPLSGAVDLQVGSAYFWYTTQGDRPVGMLIPEAGLKATVPGTPIHLAAGVGRTLVVRGSARQDFVLFMGLGAEVGVAPMWAIRPEARLHNIDPWVGSVFELGIGVRRTLGAR